MERIFGRKKTKPLIEVLLRFQEGNIEIFVEREGKTIRVRTVDRLTNTEAHRKEVEI